jgi:hypothetical protein
MLIRGTNAIPCSAGVVWPPLSSTNYPEYMDKELSAQFVIKPHDHVYIENRKPHGRRFTKLEKRKHR